MANIDIAKEQKLTPRKSELLEASQRKIPVYLAVRYDKKHMKFFCPWCHEYHFHGLTDLLPLKVTHRIAHCDKEMKDHHPHGYFIFIAE